jgi:hypothetical protein
MNIQPERLETANRYEHSKIWSVSGAVLTLIPAIREVRI